MSAAQYYACDNCKRDFKGLPAVKLSFTFDNASPSTWFSGFRFTINKQRIGEEFCSSVCLIDHLTRNLK